MNDTQTHAFPSDPAGYQPQQGLTKRELYALVILHGIWNDDNTAGTPERLAEGAVKGADALIEALKENEQ